MKNLLFSLLLLVLSGCGNFSQNLNHLDSENHSNFQLIENNQQLVYNVVSKPRLYYSRKLQVIIDELLNMAAEKGMPINDLSITLIDVNSGEFGEYQQVKMRYPASVAKLFWMAFFYSNSQQGILTNEHAFTHDLKKMIVESDNEATSRIIDKITNTKSGPKLPRKKLQAWLDKRYQMNSFFENAGYWGINIAQKTFPIYSEKLYKPKGRDLQIRQYLNHPNPIRNQISTQQAARLIYEIVKKQAISPEYSKKMASLLYRDLSLKAWTQIDPNTGGFNPVRAFFGESLPKDIYFLSKAGWTSKTRQEVAFIRTKSGKTAYILSIFAEDKAYALNRKIFPRMSRLVFDRMITRSLIYSN